MSLRRFDNQTVVITGAGSGIGRELATGYAREGARLVLAGRRASALEETARIVGDLGAEALVHPTDVRNESECVGLIEKTLERFGRLDVLLNNAGAPGTDQAVADMTRENWDDTIATNVTGPMLLTREALGQAMVRSGRGNIQFFSSAAAENVRPGKSHYAVAKMGLLPLTKTLALEVSEHGVRVNAIVIGLVEGDLVDGWVERMARQSGRSEEKVRRGLVSSIPMKRAVQAREVVDLSLYLASEASSAITGQALRITGGL